LARLEVSMFEALARLEVSMFEGVGTPRNGGAPARGAVT
jgi:hypothetical protein